MTSFRYGRSTTTSFTHRNALFPVKRQMIDRILSTVLTAARTAGADSVCKALLLKPKWHIGMRNYARVLNLTVLGPVLAFALDV